VANATHHRHAKSATKRSLTRSTRGARIDITRVRISPASWFCCACRCCRAARLRHVRRRSAPALLCLRCAGAFARCCVGEGVETRHACMTKGDAIARGVIWRLSCCCYRATSGDISQGGIASRRPVRQICGLCSGIRRWRACGAYAVPRTWGWHIAFGGGSRAATSRTRARRGTLRRASAR
jgi:hypothetical protein